MKKRRKVAFVVILILILLIPKSAFSDFFGGDLPLLAEIVANTLQELTALKGILQTGSDDLALAQEINRGINDSMNLIQTTFPHIDPGVFKNWQSASSALQGVESLYGEVAASRDAPVQSQTDQSVAEAIALNNEVYDYTAEIDDLGESIKTMSHSVSPGGAAKLTAQSLGVMLNLMNEQLRTQATGLKLQAEELALVNRREKEATRYAVETSSALQTSMQLQETNFQLPIF
jgi:hypothetical protein